MTVAYPTHSDALLNIKAAPYNAIGDGKHNDRPAIQSALDEAAKKGGTVFMPAGIYRVDAVEEPGSRIFCLLIKSNVMLKGEGRGATTLFLDDNQPNETRILTNYHYSAKEGDSNITFEDFSIDGNAAHQKAGGSFGIRCVFTQKVTHKRILIKDIKGTPKVEGASFESYSSSNNDYTDCEATTTVPGDTVTGSGFSVVYSTGIEYKGCQASRSSSWQGFTSMESRLISYVNCHAYLNQERGFNSERSSEMQYINCIAGGRTTFHSEGFPATPNASLGNKAQGFYVWKSHNVLINNCISIGNLWGIYDFESTNLRIISGVITENNFGLGFEKTEDARSTRISGAPIINANRMAGRVGELEFQTTSGPIGPPLLPASGVDFYNPYPFDASVYIYGGKVKGVSVQGQYMSGYSSGSIHLPAGGMMQIRYSKAPQWKWVIE